MVETARCPINRRLAAPKWYRLSGNGKRAAYLWIAEARGPAQPWEGFSLSLDPRLKPLTPRERTVFTDSCV